MGKESSTKRTKSARNAPTAKPTTTTPRKPPRPKTLAKKANEASIETLQTLLDKCLPSPLQAHRSTWSLYDGPTLGADVILKAQIWDLFAANMKDLYKEAKDHHIKWDPEDKQEELVRGREELLRKNGIFDVNIQVAEEHRGIGICRRAFTALESIAEEFKAQLIMLTCFKCNTEALSIYEHFGYAQQLRRYQMNTKKG